MRRSRRFAAFVFDALLLIAPRDFRAEYGPSMWRDVADNLAEECLLHGWFASFMLFAGACGDVVVAGSRERFAMIARDVVFALRSLRKTPLFSAVVVVTLALAIGANAAVFSVLRAVVLAPLPYPEPQNLVALFSSSATNGSSVSSLPDIADVRARNHVFEDIAALRRSRATITGFGAPRALQGFMATWPAFEVLGVQPELGRFFEAADEQLGAGDPIVVSDRLWRQTLGADPGAIGRPITLDAHSYRVIGVAPPGLLFPLPDSHSLEPPDYWTVLRPDLKTSARSSQRFSAIGRLRHGVSLAAANADLARISDALQAQYPATDSNFTFRTASFTDIFIGPIRPILVAAFGAVAGVLIIACANVANLLLSRSASRDRELAIRFAIGATRGRIIAQILTETLLFAAVSGMLGVVFARILVASFVALDPPGIPRLADIRVDGWVALYSFAIVLFCTLASGIVPALALSKPQLSGALKAAGRGGDANRGARARNAFVVAEIAISVALVVNSGLIVRSFTTLADTPLGIIVDDVRVATFPGLPAARYGSDASMAEFYRASAARVNAIPGVRQAAWIAGTIPLQGSQMSSSCAMQDIAQPANQEFVVPEAAIGPRYFASTGISLMAGRAFESGDRLGSAPVAIVNRAFADRYYHGQPIGKWIAPALQSLGSPLHRTIVGVVANARNSFTSGYEPTIYLPIAQAPLPNATLLIQARPAVAIDAAIAAAVVAGDPLLAAPTLRTLRSYADEQLARTRLSALLLGSLAIIALFLAAAGVYAVVSFGVAQRTQEFGIRMALGSRGTAIVRSVVARAARLAIVGILCGVFLAGLAAQLVQSQLVGIGTLDPPTYAVVVVVVAAAALIAALVPAIRATRIDPIVALRYQ